MTELEAKRTLLLCRPDTGDAAEPEFAEALALADARPPLREWFETQTQVHCQLRARFRAIRPPEGLREQILSESGTWARHRREQRLVLALVALAGGVLLALGLFLWQPRPRSREVVTVQTWSQRMISAVQRQYVMTLESADLERIRAHLAEMRAPSDYVLPGGLARLRATGCGVLSWQEKPVAMLCFHSGRPLPPEEKTDVFLFVVDRAAVPDAPATAGPQTGRLNGFATAVWSAGERVYLLAVTGDERLVREYLE
ncbi:MAG: hypothetical protein N3I86_04080 [Verrucomicrobiae bacterium]|nr:hypothetical protein [Verrucomicrobiae bacterium]MDW8307878.1 hypothetical protein [Verrucomicrobiales bacterium]